MWVAANLLHDPCSVIESRKGINICNKLLVPRVLGKVRTGFYLMKDSKESGEEQVVVHKVLHNHLPESKPLHPELHLCRCQMQGFEDLLAGH